MGVDAACPLGVHQYSTLEAFQALLQVYLEYLGLCSYLVKHLIDFVSELVPFYHRLGAPLSRSGRRLLLFRDDLCGKECHSHFFGACMGPVSHRPVLVAARQDVVAMGPLGDAVVD